MKNPFFYRRKDGSFRTDEEAIEYMETFPPTPLPIGTHVKISANDKIPPTIEYVGICNLLDILMKKIDEEKDIEKIRTYCQLYKMIYELEGSDKE